MRYSSAGQSRHITVQLPRWAVYSGVPLFGVAFVVLLSAALVLLFSPPSQYNSAGGPVPVSAPLPLDGLLVDAYAASLAPPVTGTDGDAQSGAVDKAKPKKTAKKPPVRMVSICVDSGLRGSDRCPDCIMLRESPRTKSLQVCQLAHQDHVHRLARVGTAPARVESRLKLSDGYCPRCGGSGQCTTCFGSTMAACPQCAGRGEAACPVCRGSGWSVDNHSGCDRCLGTGRLVCPKCGGAGSRVCTDCRGSCKCPRCGGTGRQRL